MHQSLGRPGRDVLTGFEGTVTARIEYLTGCNQLALQPKVNEKGELPESKWFDEQRILLDLNKDNRVVLQNEASPGFDANLSLPTP